MSALLSPHDDDYAALGAFFEKWGYGDFVPEKFATQFAHPSFGAIKIGDESMVAAVLFRHAGDECEIIEIAVAKDHRGACLASDLLAALISHLRTVGAVRLILEVAEDNQPARGLYHKHGFCEVGRRDGYYKQKITAIILELALSMA